ncbi:MAG: hypothetical protein E6151_03745 [Dialister micraerophilus]|uniref:hypothetical protein n=1 Tax=Dialister micraerophilus TaxID=309120 RepID=UPI0023F3F172|nr:hypothetical protein [Dialister micraerophilus]MDU5301583.1 hypothetical protein [Dialister micraerophilus]
MNFDEISFPDFYRGIYYVLGSDVSMTEFFREFLDMITKISPDWRYEPELSMSISNSVCKKCVFYGLSRKMSRMILKKFDPSPLEYHLSLLDDEVIQTLSFFIGFDKYDLPACPSSFSLVLKYLLCKRAAY